VNIHIPSINGIGHKLNAKVPFDGWKLNVAGGRRCHNSEFVQVVVTNDHPLKRATWLTRGDHRPWLSLNTLETPSILSA
jgi:hypothetical protein